MARAPEQDPYVVLGVARTATADEIRAAYRRLGAQYHPDRHQGNPLEDLASAKMAEINRAYEILSNPARRAAFDAGGGRGFSGSAPSSGSGEGPGVAPAGRGQGSARVIRIVALLSLLPFVVRFGGLIVRGISALLREILAAAGLLRGTPFAAGVAVLAAAGLCVAVIRRRRRAAPPSKARKE